MAQPTQLDATEQDTLVKQIGLALLRAAPQDWQRVYVEYRAVGRYHELGGEVTLSDGTLTEWVATHDITTLFGRLRAGMYREGRGTWFNARYQLDHPSSYNLEYDREEPDWDLMPPTQAYSDELQMFPRSEEDVPEWLMRRMSGLGTEQSDPHFRTARIFDGTDSTGAPLIDRDELDPEEQDRLLDYLDSAPVVVPIRGYDIDHLAGAQESRVPVAFHSDGVWIWPAAVNYYLREYGVTPEIELVEHIRSNRFTIPDVPDAQRHAAAAHLNRGVPAPQQAPPAAPQRGPMPPGPPPDQPPPSAPNPATDPATTFTPEAEVDSGPLTTVTTAVNRQPDEQVEDAASAAPHTDPLSDDPDTILERLRVTLRELRIDDTRYSIGGSARHSWSLEQVDDGWRVGWYDDVLTNPAMFGDVADAAAFILGKLLLTEEDAPALEDARSEAPASEPAPQEPVAPPPRAMVPTEVSSGGPPPAPQPPPPQPSGAPEADRAGGPSAPHAESAQPRMQQPAARPAQSEHGQQQSGGTPSNQWPIQPLSGEPPLTLFRGKELLELPAGSEIDRFGGPTGNLTYAAGTPFEERSLVPDWVNRPYHVYRVQRPLEALSGVAIPWFNQPGGGAAYMLPDSVEQHVAEGDLIELEAGEPPVE